jgi:SAM-dependent methyltransferase
LPRRPPTPLQAFLRYARFRAKARLLAARERVAGKHVENGLPVPPPLLRDRVHGSLDRSSFLAIGQACAGRIRGMLRSVGQDLYGFHDVLDFGCGCGRVMRFFADRPPSCRLHGTDIDAEAIAWCRARLRDLADWQVSRVAPPLSAAAGRFDLVYAVSVFTHFDEEAQVGWLEELRRVTRPGGWLLLTIHSAAARKALEAEERRSLEEKGFLFKTLHTGRWKLDGLPDSYQAAFQTREYVERVWSRFFEIAGYFDEGASPQQDAVVLHRTHQRGRDR